MDTVAISNINKELYERDLAERQRKHLENIQRNSNINWQPCLHHQCPQCHGTGIKLDGSACIHNISCPCPNAHPRIKNKKTITKLWKQY